jgi:hypothetical protein
MPHKDKKREERKGVVVSVNGHTIVLCQFLNTVGHAAGYKSVKFSPRGLHVVSCGTTLY